MAAVISLKRISIAQSLYKMYITTEFTETMKLMFKSIKFSNFYLNFLHNKSVKEHWVESPEA